MCDMTPNVPKPAPAPPPPPVLEQEAPGRAGGSRESGSAKKRRGLSKYKINKAGRDGSRTNSLGNVPQG